MALACVKRLKLTKDIARYEDGAVSSDYPDCVFAQKAKSLQPKQMDADVSCQPGPK
jgi:hypothetical protein